MEANGMEALYLGECIQGGSAVLAWLSCNEWLVQHVGPYQSVWFCDMRHRHEFSVGFRSSCLSCRMVKE